MTQWKIMFVCHGNICRSPMAEFILKDMVRKQGREDQFVISSSATSTEEIRNGIGNPVYPPAKAELTRRGLRCEGKRAVQLKKEDYLQYDLFVGMDSANLRNMNRIFGGDPEGKLFSLMSFTDRPGDVADPWYTGDFEATWRDADEGCRALLKYVLDNAHS